MSYNIGDIVEVKTASGITQKGEILGYYTTKADEIKLYAINIGNPYLKNNVRYFNETQIIGLYRDYVDERLINCIKPKRLPSVKELGKAYGISINYDNYINYPFSTSLLPGIKKVIFNNPATIVLWDDGTKTVVKLTYNIDVYDSFDPEKGLAMAIAKKVFGNKGNYYNEFKKWLPKED